MPVLFGCLVRVPGGPAAPGTLETVARACSPRVEPAGDDRVVFDASGLRRVLGPPEDIAREVIRLAEQQGLAVRLALSGTMTASWLLAHAGPAVIPAVTVVAPGAQAARLAPLPVTALLTLPECLAPADRRTAEAPAGGARARDVSPAHRGRRGRRQARHYRMAPGPEAGARAPADAPRDGAGARAALDRSSARAALDALRIERAVLERFDRWGVRTLGDVARLPRADVRARLGLAGLRIHQAACGEDATVLVPADAPRVFLERAELEWPVEGLEPLSFVLARLCDGLSTALERADRGAIAVTTTLRLVTRQVHVRTLHLPAPMRDARVLRTLVGLDLESHPPGAGIDVVEVEAEVAPGRITQGSLLEHSLPTPEDLATLVARLGALMGESRVGAPALVDTHDERAFAMAPFRATPPEAGSRTPGASVSVRPESPSPGASCLRRFRLPLATRVVVDRGTPVRVVPSSRGVPGGAVVACAGPWRSSGHWWTFDRSAWDRDEWDVEVSEGAVIRLSRHRATGQWAIEGILD